MRAPKPSTETSAKAIAMRVADYVHTDKPEEENKHSRRFAESDFSLNKQVDKIIALYKEMTI